MGEALVGILALEAHGGVEGGPAPALQAEELGRVPCERVGRGDHVVGAHPRREQRLVRVAQGRVGDQEPALGRGPLRELLRPELAELVAASPGEGPPGSGERRNGRRRDLPGDPALHLGIAVDGDVAQERKQLGRPVLSLLEAEQPGGGVDEAGRRRPIDEGGVGHDILKEGDVGPDSAHPEFRERPPHPGGRRREVRPGGDDLNQERVVEGGDDAPGAGHALVQPDARPGGVPVVEYLARVRGEVVGRVLGRHAALEGEAALGHLRLRGDPDLRVVEPVALGDQELGPDQVQAGDRLGHRMLNLDTRVHLDEVPLLGVDVHQELDRARVVVADGLAELQGRGAEGGPEVLGEADGGGDLDHLLVAPLDRAVPLVQVDDPAVLVAQELDLDVLGPGDEALEEDVGAAEGRLRLGLGLLEAGEQVGLVVDDPHAAAAAAVGRLDDQGEADLRGGLAGGGRVSQGVVGAGQDGDSDLLGELPGGALVAEQLEKLRAGADKRDPRGRAGAGQGRVLGEEAVAGMKEGCALLPGKGDDPLDVEVGRDGALAAADDVGLVGLEAVGAEAVLIGVDGDRPEPELGAGSKDADGDFAAVGDQKFDHWGIDAPPSVHRKSIFARVFCGGRQFCP